jgi:hypothetical protein
LRLSRHTSGNGNGGKKENCFAEHHVGLVY